MPAPDVQMFVPPDTFAHACFNCSMRAGSASVRIHDLSPNEFQTISLCPAGG